MSFADISFKLANSIESFHKKIISSTITSVFFGSSLAHFIDFTSYSWIVFFRILLVFMATLVVWTVWYYLSDKYLRKSQSFFEYVRKPNNNYGLFWALTFSLLFIFFPEINLLAGIAIVTSYRYMGVPFLVISESIRSPRKRYLLCLQDIRQKNEKQRQIEIRRQWHSRSNKTRRRIYPTSYGYQRYL